MATSTRPPSFDQPPSPEQSARLNGNGSVPGERTWHEWMMMGIGMTAALALLAIVASIVALSSKTASTTTIIKQGAAATGTAARAAGHGATSSMGAGMMASGTSPTALGSGTAQSGAGAVIPMVLQLDDTKGMPGLISGRPGWPRYVPSTITVPAGKKVTLVITNYDDAATPLAAGVPYNHVMGGQETVNGKPVSYVSNKIIAHTFTVTGLGVNAAIPESPTGGTVTVSFTFTPKKAGVYTFQCYTPCGSGKNGTGGPMMTPGFMQGTLRVL